MGLFDGTPWERPVVCERCGRPEADCECPPAEAAAPPEVPVEQQKLAVSLQKRKRGKVVTCVEGFLGSADQRRQVLSQLQSKLGAGGALGETSLEVQGDHRDGVARLLQEMGFRVRTR